MVNCGRRFGKNVIQSNIGTLAVLQGKKVAHFSPTYKMQKQVWSEFKDILFDITISKDEQHKTLKTNTKGSLSCFSMDAYDSVRGNKFDLVLLDEVAFTKNLENAWEQAIRPTLLDYKGGAYFFSTPNGTNYFKTLAEIKDSEWQYHHYTTYDNPYLDPIEIDKYKDTMPSIKFRQEILAEFVDMQGTLIQREWIKYYDYLPSVKYYVGVDLAISQKSTADYTVIAVVGYDGKNYYVVDIDRQRYTFNQTQEAIKRIGRKYNPEYITIEKVAYQSSLIQELNRTDNLPISTITPKTDKISRALGLIGKYEHGLILHNKDLSTQVENEILSFPNGEHDDVIDAIVYAMSKIVTSESTLIRSL